MVNVLHQYKKTCFIPEINPKDRESTKISTNISTVFRVGTYLWKVVYIAVCLYDHKNIPDILISNQIRIYLSDISFVVQYILYIKYPIIDEKNVMQYAITLSQLRVPLPYFCRDLEMISIIFALTNESLWRFILIIYKAWVFRKGHTCTTGASSVCWSLYC